MTPRCMGQAQVKRWLASLTLHRTTLIMPLVLLLPLPMRWDTTLAWITILLAAVLPVPRMEAASWLLQLGESGLLGLTGICRGLRGGRTRNAEWGGSAWCSSLLWSQVFLSFFLKDCLRPSSLSLCFPLCPTKQSVTPKQVQCTHMHPSPKPELSGYCQQAQRNEGWPEYVMVCHLGT